MRVFCLVVSILFLTARAGVLAKTESANPAWSMNATIIEACSCPMFCPCYFNKKQARAVGHGQHAEQSDGGGGESFCIRNNSCKEDQGTDGNTKRDRHKHYIV